MRKHYGWTGTVAHADLSSAAFTHITAPDYADRCIGGQGIAARGYWESVSRATGAFDPGNHLFLMTGPLAGTKAQAGSRWVIAGKSPLALPEQYACGNLGGQFGAALKWSGLDGLVLSGAAARPVILAIDGSGGLTLRDAAHLWGRDALETIGALQADYGQRASILCIARSGEQRVRFASIMGSGGIAAGKGFGAVMGSKNLKAIVVQKDRGLIASARPGALRELTREITGLWKGETSERCWIDAMLENVEKVRTTPCFGCPGICGRGIYRADTGESGHGKNCASAYFYAYAEKELTGSFGPNSFYATRLANQQGLCTNELNIMLEWIPAALGQGALAAAGTGLDAHPFGSREWIACLAELIISRRGIGDLLAEGSRRAARELGTDDLLEGVATRYGFYAHVYNPRLFLSTAPIYATEPVYPITQLHGVSFPLSKWMIWVGTEGMMGSITTEKLRQLAKTFWGHAEAAEFDSPAHMGSAAARIQNRAYAKENLVLCDFFWPIDYTGNRESGVGDPELEARLFSAVTGSDMDAASYERSGERCANLCRAIRLREGRSGRADDVIEEFNFSRPLHKPDSVLAVFNPDMLMPGSNGRLYSARNAVVSREDFARVMDEYYRARGWDPGTGLFTAQGLAQLGLDDMVLEFRQLGFVAD